MQRRGSCLRHGEDGKTTTISGIPYADRGEFSHENPDCCRIVSFNHPLDSGGAIHTTRSYPGSAARLVKVRYKERWTEDGQLKNQVTDNLYLGLTNCGEVNHARDYWWK